MTTTVQAYDDMASLVNSAVQSNSAAILGYVPLIVWQNTNYDAPDGSKAWLRFSEQLVSDSQATLSSDENKPGSKRYDSDGLVFVQLFMPRSVGSSGDDGRKLGEMLRNSFRGVRTANGVWFTNARLQPLPPEDLYFRYNVVAEYHFSDVY